ncbi:DUF6409 family protein [Streptomyces sp. UNOC14_S4]|uniref:DUF6409 family protein n=1 Tax=Streptomyces sp. UNOC14_S4 TaxID=2872340 RepID=UPI001E2D3EF2|nr:DUF6409 family protein [Streptomyces sp. UNOC14_S4]MCC3767277.1 hypothetical protein [Streptomyces sp. UNOC14_S4]
MITTEQAPRPSVQDFPTATLVLAGPWHRAQQLEARPGIVVGPFGGADCADEATMAVVWFFGDGAPEPGPTVQAMFPRELTPIDDTLITMDQDAFRDIVCNLRRGRFAYDDDGEELRIAVRQAWRQRAGLAETDPAARHTLHRS